MRLDINDGAGKSCGNCRFFNVINKELGRGICSCFSLRTVADFYCGQHKEKTEEVNDQ